MMSVSPDHRCVDFSGWKKKVTWKLFLAMRSVTKRSSGDCCSSQCPTTGVTKAMVCAILSVGFMYTKHATHKNKVVVEKIKW